VACPTQPTDGQELRPVSGIAIAGIPVPIPVPVSIPVAVPVSVGILVFVLRY
jgi:hypothetical protein